MIDFTWYCNREHDSPNDFSIPRKHNMKDKPLEALQKPSWMSISLVTNRTHTLGCSCWLLGVVCEQPNLSRVPGPDADWSLGEGNSTARCRARCRRPEHVKRVFQVGFSSIRVPNYSVRQLKTSPAIDVLPSIREAVGHDIAFVAVDFG